LPANSRIAANGFLAVPQSVFDLPGGGQGFRLNPLGDSVWLFSADADGNLTGWAHGFRFGASQIEGSFGRFIDAAGNEQFALQKAASIGAANSGPLESPVVINEVMYHPPDLPYWSNVDDEYIEIRNASASPVALFDPARPTNRWRLQGGIEFDLPANTTLAAGGRLVVVGFDPAADPARLESLRLRLGWDSKVTVVGPWEGHLANEGDTVRLERPGTPVADGTGTLLPYIVADQVQYESSAPWPVDADGAGASIVRRSATGFGDDPLNWVAAARLAAGLDYDADGLPDDWETFFQLSSISAAGNDGADGDPDADGFLNRHEYLNGTDPKNAASAFAVDLRHSPGQVDLFLSAPVGKRFRIESSSTLAPGSWTSLGDVTVESNGVALLKTIPVQAGARYFRVSAP
jgi:hypothetical protein